MSVTPVKLTLDDYLALPEDNRPCEFVDEELYMPTSQLERHQRVLLNLAIAIASFVQRRKLGRVYTAPVVLDAERPLVLQPDLIFISKNRLNIIKDRVYGAPDLVVEIFSPGSAKRDQAEKVKWYSEYGVRECWLVDPQKEIVEVPSPRA